ncbi:MAG: hypothetical protein QXT28_12560 [Thermofilaceae archaeon]
MLPRQARNLNIATSVYYEVLMVRNLEVASKYGILDVKPSQWRGLRTWRYKLADAPGAYELVLWDQRRGALKPEKPVMTPYGEPAMLEFDEAVFLIRYYPHPSEPCFEDFSVEEQALRLSEIFENGSASFPAEGFEDRLSELHFNVGLMMLAAGVFHSAVRLSLMSQERFVSIAEEGVELLGKQLVEPGGTDRNVAGWQLSWKLFSKVAKVYVEQLGKPYAVVERVEPGRIWICGELGCVENESNDYLLRTVEVIFIPEKEDFVINAIEESLRKIEEEVGTRPPPSDGKLIPYIQVLWREGKELLRSEELAEILNVT